MHARQTPMSELRRGRAPIAEAVLLTNGVSWYLRSRLWADRTSIVVETPRTILGLVPIGMRSFTTPLDGRTSLSLSWRVHPERLAVSAALALLAAAGPGPVGTVLTVVGAVAFLLLGIIAVVRIERVDSAPATVPVCLAHLPRARRFIEEVGGQPTSGGEALP